ncbi:ANTAR domain-containing protein [Streptomyces sp. NPDC059262]|uniref:ANTAR domain-containing protein n=1 Tax=Streptomyces sp. NPDC059262 TaxID=3346797 RepID=UPI0036B2206B
MKPDPSEHPDAPSELAAAEAKVEALQETVGQLERAVDSHADVDQAIGVILAVGKITPAEAWDALREVSMRTNTKLQQVAESVVAWGQGAVLPAELRSELDRQLRPQPQARRSDES